MVKKIRLSIDIIRNAIILLIGFALIIMFLGRQLNLHSHSKLMLIIASTGFVVAGLLNLIRTKTRYGFMIFLGLIFCWLGDYINGFKVTVIAFLLAHLCFISAFFIKGIKISKSLKSTPAVLLSSSAIAYWILPYVPESEFIFVISYIIIISAMLILSFGAKPTQLILILGAILFYISDIFVARWRFVDQSSINSFFCYPIYYTSCILFALSIKHDDNKLIL